MNCIETGTTYSENDDIAECKKRTKNAQLNQCIPSLPSLGKVTNVWLPVAPSSPRVPWFVARGHNCNVTHIRRDVIF